MKKPFIGASLICLTVMLSSCFSTQIACGENMTAKTPVVKVNSEWNHHFLFGLIPGSNAKMVAKDYVDGAENYVVKTNQTFVNGLVNFLTFGIYTPTTTTYYVSLKDAQK